MRLRYNYLGNHRFNCDLHVSNENDIDDSTESWNTDSTSEFSSDLNGNETNVRTATGESVGVSVSEWPSNQSLRYIVQQRTPTNLHNACRIGSYAAVERLLRRGADANAADSDMDHGVTPLQVALIHEHDAIVHLLLDHGATVNHAANNGWTPLHIAASNGRPRTVQTLLDHKADIHSKETRGWTPIFAAAFRGHFDVVHLLLTHHQRNQSTSNITLSNCTSNNSNMNTINIDAQDVYGQTLLMLACQRGHVDIVKLLLRHGAHVHVRDEDGATALQVASGGCREIIEHFLLTQQLTGYDNSNLSCISACRTAKPVIDDPQKLQFRPSSLGDLLMTGEQRRASLKVEHHDPLGKIATTHRNSVERINL